MDYVPIIWVVLFFFPLISLLQFSYNHFLFLDYDIQFLMEFFDDKYSLLLYFHHYLVPDFYITHLTIHMELKFNY